MIDQVVLHPLFLEVWIISRRILAAMSLRTQPWLGCCSSTLEPGALAIDEMLFHCDILQDSDAYNLLVPTCTLGKQ